MTRLFKTSLDAPGVAVSGTSVVVTSDSRLTDARTPTAHKSTHATGGTDALTASDIGAATSTHVHAFASVMKWENN